MDNKKFENPEEVRAFLDSNAFADGFKEWLVASSLSPKIAQHLEPLVLRWQHLMKTVAPVALKMMSEFGRWNVSSEVLGRAGWLPHHTMPFDLIEECGEDQKEIRRLVLNYYKKNWRKVRMKIEARLSLYKIDDEAKDTVREALAAHEAGLYRCVCRVLFPEIERVLRTELFDSEIGHIPYEKLIQKLLDYNKSIDELIIDGLYDLSVFAHITKAVREKDRIERGESPVSESDELIYGLFTKVKSEEHRERLKKNPVPNRHAALHGLVIYSSEQNSLNVIFIADYIFRVVAPSGLLPSPQQ